MKDSKARSLVKGISWRCVGTVDTFVIGYFFFGSVGIATSIAVTEVFTKIFLYFLHERGWNLIKWGRKEHHVAHVRSFAKGVSWRIIGSIDTMLLSYIFSGSIMGAVKVGSIEVFTKVALFYVHERIWALVHWGRIYTDEHVETVK